MVRAKRERGIRNGGVATEVWGHGGKETRRGFVGLVKECRPELQTPHFSSAAPMPSLRVSVTGMPH